MTTIVIPAADRNGSNPEHSIRAVKAAGGRARIITTEPTTDALVDAGGLLLADGGLNAELAVLGLLSAALARDMPVLATGSGMHVLNACFGGQPAGQVCGHWPDDPDAPRRHQIYLSPGSKVAAIIGSAGMFRVNSRHRLGLREAQRAERLMSIAYQLDDGIIEGLESKEHSWVIGVQFLPERQDELPSSFNNLFLGLIERAEEFTSAKR